MNEFLHNEDIKLERLHCPTRYRMNIATDINKYENNAVYINYLAGYENTI